MNEQEGHSGLLDGLTVPTLIKQAGS